MIDHVSVGVRDLVRAAAFYEPVLAVLGMSKLREWPDAAVGYGKAYPEFWINARPERKQPDDGLHICLRAPSVQAVDAFHATALQAGGTCDGAPGLRPEYNDRYYAAFVVDPDGNKLEAVTFLPGSGASR